MRPNQNHDGLPFSIRAVDAGGDLIRIEVRGELDIATAPDLNAGLLRELVAGHNVELDLDKVEFMDASPLGTIMGARTRFERRRQSLRIRLRPSSQPYRLLSLTGILPLLTISDPVEPPASARNPSRNRERPTER